MSPELGVVIMMNNYLHDVATALLLASGIALWIAMKQLGSNADTAVTDYFRKIDLGLTRLAKISLFWVMLGAVPRILAYNDFEWANAAGNNQMPALIIKHFLILIVVTSGVLVWIKLKKNIRGPQKRESTIK